MVRKYSRARQARFQRYELHAFVIVPNHVHLVWTFPLCSQGSVTHMPLKSKNNRLIARSQPKESRAVRQSPKASSPRVDRMSAIGSGSAGGPGSALFLATQAGTKRLDQLGTGCQRKQSTREILQATKAGRKALEQEASQWERRRFTQLFLSVADSRIGRSATLSKSRCALRPKTPLVPN